MRIIAAAMNQVSSWEFAIDCDKAGFWSSVALQIYPMHSYHELLKKCPTDCIWSGNEWNLDHIPTSVPYIEMVLNLANLDKRQTMRVMEKFQDSGTTIFLKLVTKDCLFPIKLADYVIIKSADGGGCGNDFLSTPDKIKLVKSLGKKFLMSGGIATKQHIDNALAIGAEGVAVGTIIAASTESPLHPLAKQKLIEASASETSTYYTPHRGLILTEIDEDFNHTRSLRRGIKTGQSGHIYCGTAVNHIKEILPLKEILRQLTD